MVVGRFVGLSTPPAASHVLSLSPPPGALAANKHSDRQDVGTLYQRAGQTQSVLVCAHSRFTNPALSPLCDRVTSSPALRTTAQSFRFFT